MKRFSKVVGALMVVAGLTTGGVSLSDRADATPNYASQTGVVCSSCHTLSSGPTGGENSLKVSTESRTDTPITTSLSVSSHPTGKILDVGSSKRMQPPSSVLTSGFLGVGDFAASVVMSTQDNYDVRLIDDTPGVALWYRFAYSPKIGDTGLSIGVIGERRDRASSPSMSLTPQVGSHPISVSLRPKGSTEDALGLDARINRRFGALSIDLAAQYLAFASGPSQSVTSGDTLSQATSRDSFAATAALAYNRVVGLSAGYHTYRTRSASTPDEFGDSVASVGAWINIGDRLTLESQFLTSIGSEKTNVNDASVFTLMLLTRF